MAQANSVLTAIRGPVTGALSKTSTNGSADRLWVIGGSAPYLPPIESQTSFVEIWREICRRTDPDNPREVQDCRWHTAITGGMPFGQYLAAVCYATVVILLGWYPWNFILIWLLCGGSKHLQLNAIYNPAESGGLRSHWGRR